MPVPARSTVAECCPFRSVVEAAAAPRIFQRGILAAPAPYTTEKRENRPAWYIGKIWGFCNQNFLTDLAFSLYRENANFMRKSLPAHIVKHNRATGKKSRLFLWLNEICVASQ